MNAILKITDGRVARMYDPVSGDLLGEEILTENKKKLLARSLIGDLLEIKPEDPFGQWIPNHGYHAP